MTQDLVKLKHSIEQSLAGLRETVVAAPENRENAMEGMWEMCRRYDDDNEQITLFELSAVIGHLKIVEWYLDDDEREVV